VRRIWEVPLLGCVWLGQKCAQAHLTGTPPFRFRLYRDKKYRFLHISLLRDHGSASPVSVFEAVGLSRSFQPRPPERETRYDARMIAGTGDHRPRQKATRFEPRSSSQQGGTARRERGPRP